MSASRHEHQWDIRSYDKSLGEGSPSTHTICLLEPTMLRQAGTLVQMGPYHDDVYKWSF